MYRVVLEYQAIRIMGSLSDLTEARTATLDKGLPVHLHNGVQLLYTIRQGYRLLGDSERIKEIEHELNCGKQRLVAQGGQDVQAGR